MNDIAVFILQVRLIEQCRTTSDASRRSADKALNNKTEGVGKGSLFAELLLRGYLPRESRVSTTCIAKSVGARSVQV